MRAGDLLAHGRKESYPIAPNSRGDPFGIEVVEEILAKTSSPTAGLFLVKHRKKTLSSLYFFTTIVVKK